MSARTSGNICILLYSAVLYGSLLHSSSLVGSIIVTLLRDHRHQHLATVLKHDKCLMLLDFIKTQGTARCLLLLLHTCKCLSAVAD